VKHLPQREAATPEPVDERSAQGGNTLREAKLAFFEAAGLPADGGYEARFVWFRVLGMWVGFPNTAARVRALRYHDLHHALTDYRADWMGEAQIGAWEVASGCRGFLAAWVLNLWAMSAGLVISPAKTFRAFVRGRHSSNLYAQAYGDELLDRNISDVRRASGLEAREGPAGLRDVLAFAGFSALSLGLAGLPLVLVGLGGWALVAKLSAAG